MSYPLTITREYDKKLGLKGKILKIENLVEPNYEGLYQMWEDV